MSERSKEEMLKIIQSHAEIVQKLQKAYKEEILKLQKEKEDLRNEVHKLLKEIEVLKNPPKQLVPPPKEEQLKFFKHPTLQDIIPYKEFYLDHLKFNKIGTAFDYFVKAHYIGKDGFDGHNPQKISISAGKTIREFQPIQFFKILYPNHFRNLMLQLAKKENSPDFKNIANYLHLSDGLCQEIFIRHIISP